MSRCSCHSRLKAVGWLCPTLAALLGLICAIGTPVPAEARPLELHTYLFTEGVAIPFTRLTGSKLNPGALVGLGWRWVDGRYFALVQTGYVMAFFHDPVERGVLAGTELGLRATASFGLAAELGLGVAYLHAFSGSPRYEQDESGSYVQVRDWGRPRFSPTSHIGLGYDFSRLTALPLAVFLQYGNFTEIPHSSSLSFPALPHVTLGLNVRYTIERSSP